MSAVAQLLMDLSDPDASVRHEATLALGGCTWADADWVPDLIAGLQGPDGDVRFWTAIALGRIGPAAAEGVPALIALLTDPVAANRQAAAHALSRIGQPAAAEAAPALIAALATEGSDPAAAVKYDRAEFVRSLGTFGRWVPEAVDQVARALADESPGVRLEAASQLAMLGEKATRAAAELERASAQDDQPKEVRSQIEAALDGIRSGRPAARINDPGRSLSEAARQGRFRREGVDGAVDKLIDQADFAGALDLLEKEAEDDQNELFWVEMHFSARTLGLPSAVRYYERWLDARESG